MLQQTLHDTTLDAVFHALADPTRRTMVERLTRGPATVSELARPFDMTLSAVTQHVKLLEMSGLVCTAKKGRVRSVALSPQTLARAEDWFHQHRARWEQRFDRLGAVLADDDDDTTPNTEEKT